MAPITHPESTEVAMPSNIGTQIDMIRLAALLGRLEAHEGGVCTVEGCRHEHAGVTEQAAVVAEHALAA